MATGVAILVMTVARGAHAEMVTIEEFIGRSIGQQIGDTIVKGAQFKDAKDNANAEFDQARSAFYAQLTDGILGSPEEQNFAELLYDKDIYYLSLNVSEGVRSSAQRLKALDMLSGGAALDGGIPGWPADDLFDAWVTKVRSHLGATADGQLIFVFDPVALKQAIDATRPSYDRYRKARDEQEFKRWRASRPLIVEPKADTPEERARTYIDIVLKDAIDDAMSKLSKNQQEEAMRKIRPWIEQLRKAIIDHESRPITPEVVASYMEAKKYSKADQDYFWSELGAAKDLKGNDFVTAVDKALEATIRFRDLRLYGQAAGASLAVVDAALKNWVTKNSGGGNSKSIEEVYASQPVPFPRVTYLTVADLISSGHLGREPPLPAFHRVDGDAAATGAPLPAPAIPPAEAALEKKVASLPSAEKPEQVPTPKASEPPQADQALAGGETFELGLKTFSMGISLGDKLDAADKIVRSSKTLIAVINNDPKAWGYGPAFLTGRAYVMEGDRERLGLLWLPHDPEKRIVAISRRFRLPTPPISQEAANKLVIDQFGPSDSKNAAWPLWYGGKSVSAYACGSISLGSNLGNGFVVTEGTLPKVTSDPREVPDPTQNAMAAFGFLYSFIYPDGHVQEISGCPQVVWSNYNPDPTRPTLIVGKVDGSLVARLLAELAEAAPQADLGKMMSGQN
jgi:hypothetical protein